MLLSINSFRGEAPRVTPRALPDNAAQDATNARLLSGDLEAWRQFAAAKALTTSAPVRTIYKLGDAWLSWASDVDVARGTIAGDTTMRTYITGPDVYDEPRWTNYAMATTGSEPYPVTTRPLGVPSPGAVPTLTVGVDPNSSSGVSVDVVEDGSTIATEWTLGGGNPYLGDSISRQSNVEGNPAPSLEMGYGRNGTVPAFAYRNFGIADGAVIVWSFDFRLRPPSSGEPYRQMTTKVANSSDGVGMYVQYTSTGGLTGGLSGPGWNTSTLSSQAVEPMTLTDNVWYRCSVTIQRNSDGTNSVTVRITLGDVLVGEEITWTNRFDVGNYCGFVQETPIDSDASPYWTHYDNIRAQASGTLGYNPVNIATSYLFTYFNNVGDQSGPSLPSATVLRPDGVSITVSTPVGLPTGISGDYGLATKGIYRAVTGASGTVFRLVAEIPLSQAEFIDSLRDDELGEVLPSELWTLPPADLEGILALPNGVMVGFSKNQLCFSAQNYPHAWPVEYRLTVDTDIVAIGAIDTTVVIFTEAFIYLATGNDPASYGMSKLEVPQACVAKRSIAYLTGIGVVAASPDGLIAVGGTGQVRNLTSSVFTREQWQTLNPESIIATAHEDVYWMFYDTGTVKGGYAIDMKPDGFGLVSLSFHATAVHSDPLTDKLFLVLDEVDDPSSPYLPLPSTAPTPNGATVYAFNAEEGDGRIAYRWRGKLSLLPKPVAFQVCQVKAADYGNLLLRLYVDSVMLIDMVVESGAPFTLPMVDDYEEVEIEFLGTSRVRSVQLAEDIEELI